MASDRSIRAMGCFENLASRLFAGLYFPCKDFSEILGDIGEVQ